jgi:hypothetical protein
MGSRPACQMLKDLAEARSGVRQGDTATRSVLGVKLRKT